MLGVHFFNVSHFVQQLRERGVQCSERNARRWLRSWAKARPDEFRDGEHVRLYPDQLHEAVHAWQHREKGKPGPAKGHFCPVNRRH